MFATGVVHPLLNACGRRVVFRRPGHLNGGNQIGLPDSVLEKVYHKNAERIFKQFRGFGLANTQKQQQK